MADHSPDYPFGCTVMWGDPVVLPDMPLHVCNRTQVGHDGRCVCRCGSTPEGGDDG